MQPNYPYIKRLITQLRNEVYAQTDTEDFQIWHEFADQYGPVLRPLVEMVDLLASGQEPCQTWNGVLNDPSVASEPSSKDAKIARLAQCLYLQLQPFFEADAGRLREELWSDYIAYAVWLREVIRPFTLPVDQRDRQFKFVSVVRKIEVIAKKVLEDFEWA